MQPTHNVLSENIRTQPAEFLNKRLAHGDRSKLHGRIATAVTESSPEEN